MRLDGLTLVVGLAGASLLTVALAAPDGPERDLAEAARRAVAAARPGDCIVLGPAWESRRVDTLAASTVPVLALSDPGRAFALGCARVWLIWVPGVGLDDLPAPAPAPTATASTAPAASVPEPVAGVGPWLVTPDGAGRGSPP
jgi:hypothetical protein